MKAIPLARSGRILVNIAFLLVCSAICASAQSLTEAAVPASALQSFQAAQPGATAEWKAGPRASYEAWFVQSGKAMVYVFDGNGALRQKKLSAATEALPPAIRQSVAKLYPGTRPVESYKVMTRSKKRFFEVVMETGNRREYLRYDLSGKPVARLTMERSVPEETQTAAAETPAERPAATAPTVTMRGEAAAPAAPTPTSLSEEDVFSDEALIDDDILDLVEEEEEDPALEFGNDDDWEDIDLDKFEQELFDDEEEGWEDLPDDGLI